MSEGGDSLPQSIGVEATRDNRETLITQGVQDLLSFDRKLRERPLEMNVGAAVNYFCGGIDNPDLPGITLTAFKRESLPTEWGVAIFENDENTGGKELPNINLTIRAKPQESPRYTLWTKASDEEMRYDQVQGSVTRMRDRIRERARDLLDETRPWKQIPSEQKHERDDVHSLAVTADFLDSLLQIPLKGEIPKRTVDAVANLQGFVIGSNSKYVESNELSHTSSRMQKPIRRF